jgi:hypothetical protein
MKDQENTLVLYIQYYFYGMRTPRDDPSLEFVFHACSLFSLTEMTFPSIDVVSILHHILTSQHFTSENKKPLILR